LAISNALLLLLQCSDHKTTVMVVNSLLTWFSYFCYRHENHIWVYWLRIWTKTMSAVI